MNNLNQFIIAIPQHDYVKCSINVIIIIFINHVVINNHIDNIIDYRYQLAMNIILRFAVLVITYVSLMLLIGLMFIYK